MVAVLTHIAREIGLLRSSAENLISKPLPLDPITEDFLRAEGLHRAIRHTSGIVAIRQPGGEAFTELSESIIGQYPAMERGTVFTNFQMELFNALATGYVGRDPSSIGVADVSALHDYFSAWFANSASPRTIFVPCAVSPWPSPRFAGSYGATWMTNEPGLVIGPGTLADIVKQTQTLINAVGSCVRSFTTGHYRFPALERAWCDAAY